MPRVQKIQQNTILKNCTRASDPIVKFKKYNKIQSLRTELQDNILKIMFKKYNKIQSLRTVI